MHGWDAREEASVPQDVPPPPPSLSPTSLSPAALEAPATQSRSWRAVLAAIVSIVALVVVAPRLAAALEASSTARAQAAAPIAKTVAPAPSVDKPIEISLDDRADANLDRQGTSWCAGGVLVLPPSFASEDGAYDLVLHFHGATKLVEESFDAVHVNAVVVVFNFGLFSSAYSSRFSYAGALDSIREAVNLAMQHRGLVNPHLRRLALSAFSAGYAAVERALEVPGAFDQVDSVLLLDGIHTSFEYGHHLAMERISGFTKFARAAADGKKLFYVTHSHIPTYGYASTTVTTDALLAELGLTRQDGGDRPEMPSDVPSIATAISRKDLKPLDPTSHAEKGNFYLRGYSGETKADHMSHLLQMSSTALPLLAKRWHSQ